MAVQYGLLIDYDYCSGCETCVVACREEHDFTVGKWGIRGLEDGPWQKDDTSDDGNCFNWNYIPVPTDLCDLCADRLAAGRKPTCVHHCQADVMTFGTVDELAPMLKQKPKQVLFVPRDDI